MPFEFATECITNSVALNIQNYKCLEAITTPALVFLCSVLFVALPPIFTLPGFSLCAFFSLLIQFGENAFITFDSLATVNTLHFNYSVVYKEVGKCGEII